MSRPVLSAVAAGQGGHFTQILHRGALADTDGSCPGQVAGVQQGKRIKIVKIFLLCQINDSAIVGVLAAANKAILINTMCEQLRIACNKIGHSVDMHARECAQSVMTVQKSNSHLCSTQSRPGSPCLPRIRGRTEEKAHHGSACSQQCAAGKTDSHTYDASLHDVLLYQLLTQC